MKYKHVDTGGIGDLAPLEGSRRWYWGTDYAGGDLYEAEEAFQAGYEIKRNRLVFISYPEGGVYEPVRAGAGQYLGRPVCCQGEVYCLAADFMKKNILIWKCSADMMNADLYVQLSLDEVKDCYNLMLLAEPLTLCRQGHENRFQVLWPEKGDFAVEKTKSVFMRDGEHLVFSKWHEDEDLNYSEEVIVRKYPSGEVLEKSDGTLLTLPDGSHWILR